MLTLTILFLAMKKLFRKIFRNTALLLVLAGGVGCSAAMDMAPTGDVAPDMEGYVTTFGEIFGEEHKILTDDGLELYIEDVAESISWSELREMRGRVLLNYSIVGTSIHENLFLIKVNRFYPFVEKRVEILDGADSDVSRSAGPNNEGGFDVYSNPNFVSLLEGPAMPYEVGVGGGYININVFYYAESADFVPEVSLVWDVATSNDSTALFQLVGEDWDEMYSATAGLRSMWHTFRVGEEIAERIEGVSRYAFFWRWWANENTLARDLADYTSIMTNPSLGGSSSRRIIGYMQ